MSYLYSSLFLSVFFNLFGKIIFNFVYFFEKIFSSCVIVFCVFYFLGKSFVQLRCLSPNV